MKASLSGARLLALAAVGCGPMAAGVGDAGDGAGGGSSDAQGDGVSEAGAAEAGTLKGCGGGSLRPGDTAITLPHDGVDRAYIVHVPASYDGGHAVPLVLDLHGLTSNDSEQEALSGWREKADATGFIVVYPNGLGGSWNGGNPCCGSSLRDNVDDEGFLRAVRCP
jgi:poly(3-hydroxybutyrate) depolymerase